MIRLFAAALMGLLMTSHALAQTSNTCAPKVKMLQTIQEKFGEEPLADASIGKDPKTKVVLFTLNAETGSWTLLGEPPEQPGVYCVLMGGFNFRPTSVESPPPAVKGERGA
jgi:hypothetical protein